MATRNWLKKTIPAMLLLALVPACASLDRHVTLKPEDRVVVEMRQPPSEAVRNELVQTLCSESVLDRGEFYQSRNSDPLTKIVAPDRMQLLLDAFATGGFFERGARSYMMDFEKKPRDAKKRIHDATWRR